MARRMTTPRPTGLGGRPPYPRAHPPVGRSHAARPSLPVRGQRPPDRGRTPRSRERESVNPQQHHPPRKPPSRPTGSSSSTPTAGPSRRVPPDAPACSSTENASPSAGTGPSPSSSAAAPTTTPSRTTSRSGPPPAAGPQESPSSSRPPAKTAPSTRRRSSTARTSPAGSTNGGATAAGAGARSGTGHPGSTTAAEPPTGCRPPSRASSRTRSTASPDWPNARAPSAWSSRTASSDTQKILNPGIHGEQYQQGPLYNTHLRAYIRELWGHRCAYCGKAAWESQARFEIDHVVPRSKGGATNVGNLVLACRGCNQTKANKDVDAFLAENPERSTAVLRRAHRRTPLAAAGAMAWICQTLVNRLHSRGLTIRTTTGADTAYTRRQLEIPKSHANDAACCGAERPVTQLRQPSTLTAIGHGRRKQIKGLPETPYLRWRLRPPSERREIPCPGHAHHPNIVHGIRTGDLVKVFGRSGWVRGRAQVEARRNRVTVKNKTRTASNSRSSHLRRLAPGNGYAESK